MTHSNLIVDADPHFTISAITRKITNESSKKVTLIQYDHNSERFSFEVDKIIEAHDMTECDRVEIHYNNIENGTKNVNKGLYIVDDLQTNPENPEKVVFTWLLSKQCTKYVGVLSFSIRFICLDDDSVAEYVWNTAINKEISVSEGLNNDEAAFRDSPDFIAELENKIAINEQNIQGLANMCDTNYYWTTQAIDDINAKIINQPRTDFPYGDIYECNTAYHLGECDHLSVVFPSIANDGDVIYINFYVGEMPINFWMITTNTSDMELIPEPNTGYEIYAKYVQNLGIWVVNYSEYTIGG